MRNRDARRKGLRTASATRNAAEVTATSEDALAPAKGGKPEPTVRHPSDDSFGNEAECAADALFVKRLSLIAMSAVVLICLLTLVLAQAT